MAWSQRLSGSQPIRCSKLLEEMSIVFSFSWTEQTFSTTDVSKLPLDLVRSSINHVYQSCANASADLQTNMKIFGTSPCLLTPHAPAYSLHIPLPTHSSCPLSLYKEELVNCEWHVLSQAEALIAEIRAIWERGVRQFGSVSRGLRGTGTLNVSLLA